MKTEKLHDCIHELNVDMDRGLVEETTDSPFLHYEPSHIIDYAIKFSIDTREVTFDSDKIAQSYDEEVTMIKDFLIKMLGLELKKEEQKPKKAWIISYKGDWNDSFITLDPKVAKGYKKLHQFIVTKKELI